MSCESVQNAPVFDGVHIHIIVPAADDNALPITGQSAGRESQLAHIDAANLETKIKKLVSAPNKHANAKSSNLTCFLSARE